MPPYVSRKRDRTTSPPTDDAQLPPAKRKAVAAPKPKSRANSKAVAVSKPRSRKRASLFETADASDSPNHSLADTKAFLASINDSDEDDDTSDVDSDDFEDVDIAKRGKRSKQKGKAAKRNAHETEESEMDWEDAIAPQDSSTLTKPPSVSGDLELTLDQLPTNQARSLANSKKGPSKIERMVRMNTHCMHVQYLLFHNHVRNHWINDKVVQKNVIDSLTPGIQKEVERWKTACGIDADKRAKTTGKSLDKTAKVKSHKNQRDWGHKADRAEQGAPNLSQGDPTLRLLKTLCAFWRKRFTVTAPGMRKQGYKDLKRLEEEVRSHRENPDDVEQFGERIQGLKGLQELARRCEGSRDVGAQLFTAMLRGLGLEARLVANLQVIGFGWSKSEEAKAKSEKSGKAEDSDDSDEDDEVAVEAVQAAETKRNSTPPKQVEAKVKKAMEPRSPRANRKPRRGTRADPVKLEDDTSGLSDVPDSDNDSVIDITPAKTPKTNKRYDRDLPFPSYWTEVLSPISNTWIPIDPIIFNLVSTTPDSLASFEPRGAKADKAKQVLGYVVAFSSDLSAKDVTVRYLKRHTWPGKTKGIRMPIEKVPIYNSRGKISHHEEYDWFKHVLKSYTRHPVKQTPADRIEDTTDLVPVHPVRETKTVDGEEVMTLQSLKSSADFVLERHLRREEALLPTASPAKHFTSGKGDAAKSEPVYRRADVVACKTIESWHKEGRAVKDEQVSNPLKHVPMRAVTLQRKREIEEAERESGEKLKQPLYARHQTEWIIPPPIKGGVIPKNAFGNMDVYVDTMVPKGAVHVPFRGTAKLCKRLGIDFAEACTGFEFGNKRAVPVLTGVVVAAENKTLLIDAWRAEEKEKKRKEKEKREKLAMTWWRKMYKGLCIVERVRREYGDQADSHVAIELKKKGVKGSVVESASKTKGVLHQVPKNTSTSSLVDLTSDNEVPAGDGGFLLDDQASVDGGGFLADQDYHDDDVDHAGGFILEDSNASKAATPSDASHPPRKPISLMAMHTIAADAVLEAADKDEVGITGSDNDLHAVSPERDTGAAAAPAKRKASAKAKPQPARTAPAANGVSKRKRTTKRSEASAVDAPVSSGRKAPARLAARRSSARVKSHYFAKSDDEDDEDADATATATADGVNAVDHSGGMEVDGEDS